MSSPPARNLTFLLTDIEGSTSLLQFLEDRYVDVVGTHRRLLREAFLAWGGQEIDTAGDGFFITFTEEAAAVKAAVAAQRAIAAYSWPEGAPVRVRIGMHTGQAVPAFGGYVGLDVHRAARIMAAGYGGEILLSQATQSSLEGALPEDITLRDLGEHRLRDLSRAERIFQVVTPDLPSDFPPLRTLDVASNNLPIQLTSFVGRVREMTEVRRLLPTTRLLTLHGAGGVGKTRLAIHVAANLIEDFRDGVWLVDFAPLSDPALVVQAVASTLGVREMSGRTLLNALLDVVRPKKLLLLFDNCEHLASACAHLAESLLHSCPSLQIVATTREPLSIPGELTYRVPPLSFPDLRGTTSVEQLRESEAVRLFTERAGFVVPDFSLTQENAPVVAEICERLDGMPLAIELAAARVRGMSVQQIAARLNDRFRLLTGGGRTVLPKHQTLRGAMDWSYDLLSHPERILLGRLAVFAGSWTLEAAEAICSGEKLDRRDILDSLMLLVDRSLVLADGQDGDVRYRLLETMRQYASEKLAAAGETAWVRERHRRWYLALAEKAEPMLRGTEQGTWLKRLEAEHDNLHAAIDSCPPETAEQGLRLAASLTHFWNMRGYLTEGREKIMRSLATAEGKTRPEIRSKGLYSAGILAYRQGDYAEGRRLLEESLQLRRGLGDQRGIAESLDALGTIAYREGDLSVARSMLQSGLEMRMAVGDKDGVSDSLNSLGLLAWRQGDHAAARSLFEKGMEIAKISGNKRRVAFFLNNLGNLAAQQSDWAPARSFYEESLTISRTLGDRAGIASVLHNLGSVASHEGNYQTAELLLEESLAIKRELGDRAGITISLNSLGWVAWKKRDYARAESLFLESLSLAYQVGDRWGIAYSFEGLAILNSDKGDAHRAVVLFGAAEALRETIGAPLRGPDQRTHDEQLSATRHALGDDFSDASRAGRSMKLDDAIRFARREHDPDDVIQSPPRSGA